MQEGKNSEAGSEDSRDIVVQCRKYLYIWYEEEVELDSWDRGAK
jgi:hypothetical protein